MARRVGMRVEVFSIGFGSPLISWLRDGVKWQIGWLPFGGYVKITGQEIEKDKDPYSIPNSFFSKSPLDRIKVAFMGPFVNIVFAFLIFGGLWLLGGREKNFSEFTHIIGWVDPHSELYKKGIRPGDEIVSYDGNPYVSSKDNLYAPMVAGDEIEVKGFKVDYLTGQKTPYVYNVKTYPHPAALGGEVRRSGYLSKLFNWKSARPTQQVDGIKTSGILNSANYIIFNRLPNGAENPLPEGSPLRNSGIEYGDRVAWVDGELIFSNAQLSHVLNDHRALLTILRGNNLLLKRVPRVLLQELKLDPRFKEELIDWQFEAQLNQHKFSKLYAIPYVLSNDAVVEGEAKFIDKEKQEEAFPAIAYSKEEESLQPGDIIVAIDGVPISHSYQLLSQLQTHRVSIIVERNPEGIKKISSGQADASFDKDVQEKDIHKIASSIGTKTLVSKSGNLVLLNTVVPKMRSEFALSPEKQAWAATEMLEQKKEIESIEDPEQRNQALRQLENQEKVLLLGLPMVQDRKVSYNPGPLELFKNVFQEIWHTLVALISGHMSPKWLSGPIGIVQVIHDNSMVSLKEALFWLGAISLNLGVLNLLPIPIVDGGTIVMTFIEMITRKKINPKTMEKIVIPFAILLIAFFIFLTYHDLSRIFGIF
jgi:regulator of sigma E protease